MQLKRFQLLHWHLRYIYTQRAVLLSARPAKTIGNGETLLISRSPDTTTKHHVVSKRHRNCPMHRVYGHSWECVYFRHVRTAWLSRLVDDRRNELLRSLHSVQLRVHRHLSRMPNNLQWRWKLFSSRYIWNDQLSDMTCKQTMMRLSLSAGVRAPVWGYLSR
jgi:hypothetical protein